MYRFGLRCRPRTTKRSTLSRGMRNLREADVVLHRAIARLGRLHLSSTAEINEVAALQAELKSARTALERTQQRIEAIEQGGVSTGVPRSQRRYAALFEH